MKKENSKHQLLINQVIKTTAWHESSNKSDDSRQRKRTATGIHTKADEQVFENEMHNFIWRYLFIFKEEKL